MKELLKNLPRMIIFTAVAEHKSFSAASEALGIGKSVVSDHIANLEKSLAVRLLNRSTRKISLTEAGINYLYYCQKVLEYALEGQEVISSLNSKPVGTLTVSTTTHFGSIRLPEIIAKFSRQYPDITIKLKLENGFVNLVEDRVDVAIRHNHGKPTDSNLCAKLLDHVPVWICATPHYLQSHPKVNSPEDLLPHDWVHVDWLNDRWNLANANKKTEEIKIQSRYTANTIEGTKALMLKDMGLAIMPEFAVINDIINGSVVRVLPDYDLPTMTVSAVYASKNNLSMKIRAFIDFLGDELKEDQRKRAYF